MPDIDGEELARQIKKNPKIENTALIMFTSAGGKGYYEAFSSSRVFHHTYLSQSVLKSLYKRQHLFGRNFHQGIRMKLITTDHLLSNKKSNMHN